MNEGVDRNKKLFLKELSKVKDGNERLVMGQDGVRRRRKEHFNDLYDIDNQEQVAIHMRCFDGIQRDDYFGEEPIGGE